MPRRRYILRAILALCAAFVARRGAAAGPAAVGTASMPEIAALRALVTDRDAYETLGAMYLQSLPVAERCADRLTRPLVPEARAASSMEGLRQAIGRRIRTEFAERRTVGVDGWILAETEARLLGLVAIGYDVSASGEIASAGDRLDRLLDRFRQG
jgi:hypothetical protein